MRQPKKLVKNDGFTIIEVLIVLAIAGLIMLIVFLAVPALQRNSRNTQRKSDVQSILSAYSEYVNNNNGDSPDPSSCTASADAGASAGGSSSTAGCFLTNAKLAFYKDASKINYQTSAPQTPDKKTAAASVYVVRGAQCKGNNPDTTTATDRNVVGIFWIESSGGVQMQCLESGS